MKCLRCGRQVPDGALFCKECEQTVGAPLKESPYLSARVILPAREKRLSKPEKRKEPQKELKDAKKEPAEKRSRGLIAAVVVLALLCAALAVGGVLACLRDMRGRSQLAAQSEETARLSAQLEERDAMLSQEQEENDALRERIGAQENARSEQSPQPMRSLLRVRDVDADSEAEIRRLSGELETLQRENSALQVKAEFLDQNIVFVENDGTGYYHTYDCPSFVKHSYWAFSKELAALQGYTPCPDCQ